MARKADIKVCRYSACRYREKKVNIAEEEYVADGKKYYHADCYTTMEAEAKTEEKIKSDIQLIKNMWVENISNTVVLSQLYLEINKLVRERGIATDYVIFVLDYCIKNHCNLRYPGGLKYYVDKQDIKDAFKKDQARKIINNATFCVDETMIDHSPKFTINRKPSGFKSILGEK